MSRSTISTFQLFQMFPDEETARLYLESRLWPKGETAADVIQAVKRSVNRNMSDSYSALLEGGDQGSIVDMNGNTVGKWEVTA